MGYNSMKTRIDRMWDAFLIWCACRLPRPIRRYVIVTTACAYAATRKDDRLSAITAGELAKFLETKR